MRVNITIQAPEGSIGPDGKSIFGYPDKQTLNVKSFNGIYGKILCWFGYAVKVKTASSNPAYVSINSLAKQLIAKTKENQGAITSNYHNTSQAFNYAKKIITTNFKSANEQPLSPTQLNTIFYNIRMANMTQH